MSLLPHFFSARDVCLIIPTLLASQEKTAEEESIIKSNFSTFLPVWSFLLKTSTLGPNRKWGLLLGAMGNQGTPVLQDTPGKVNHMPRDTCSCDVKS